MIPAIAIIAGSEGWTKITYLYNLRTCRLEHFVSNEDFFPIKTLMTEETQARTKSLELPAELAPEVWPSMAFGGFEVVADCRKKAKRDKKEGRKEGTLVSKVQAGNGRGAVPAGPDGSP